MSRQHVGPTIETKTGFTFQVFSEGEGMRSHTFATRSQAASERGLTLKGLRVGSVSYRAYVDARSFGRAIRDLRGKP